MIRLLLVLVLLTGTFSRLRANCTAPSLLSAGNVTDSSAVLTWTDVGDAYEIELRKLSEPLTGSPTHTVPGDPPFTVTGLIPGEQYRFRVRTLCAGGGESAWSVTRNFSTDLNNARPCPLDFTLRDTTCVSGGQLFDLWVDDAPGNSLGTDVYITGVRLVITHPWRSDLSVWLTSPDGTRIKLVSGLNAGDQNLGNPNGNGGCGQFIELTDYPGAPPLSAAAESDNITGLWQSVTPLVTFHTGQNPNDKWILEICDSKLNHTGKLKLAQLVFEPAACPAPDGLQASGISINGADIHWNTGSVTGDSIQLIYGPKGFIPNSSAGIPTTLASGIAQPFLLPGLSGLQAYDVYLRQKCANGIWSGYGAPVSFFTVCPATITETFDSLGICPTACADPCPLPGLWQNAAGDDYEWKVRTGQGITFPTAGPPSAYGGSGNYLFFRNSCTPSGANNKKAILRTLCVDINAPSGTSCHFSLDLYMNTKLGQMGSLLLEITTNGGISWQTVRSWSGNQGKAWKREFINLNSYHGQTVLLQLTASGVTGAYGDIAVDNLTFYGSVQAGSPDYTFYRDVDGDGYGETNQKLIACSPVPPVGYVALSGDCDDQSPAIFPSAFEIKCNGIDENCNGMADDQFIPAPFIQPNSGVCKGGSVTLITQNPTPIGQYYWFNAPSGGLLLGTGNQLSLQNITSETTVWVVDSFANGGCASTRVATAIEVLPTPEWALGQAPEICKGTALNLANLELNDIALSSGTTTFHSAFPPSPGNALGNLLIQPLQSTQLYAVKTTGNGCADTIAIPVIVFSNPSVDITNGSSISVCKGRSVTLSATGSPGVDFAWNNGLNFSNISITANIPGTATYTVTVSDSNGCTATDQIAVETLPGITQTSVVGIQHVTTCGGNDGSISLQALDGLAPYTFSWTGPNMSSGTIGGIGVNGGVIGGLTQGGYRITVTDANGSGCSMVLPSLVINAPGLTVSQPVITSPACAGGTGTVSLSVLGVAPAFLWSNSATTASVTNLAPGLYTVTIIDGNCQQILTGLEVTAPPALQILENSITNIDCFGKHNGAIDIAVIGGTPGYSYAWSDSITSIDRSGLSPGAYTLTVTDSRLCTAITSPIYVQEPDALQILPVITPVTCNGNPDGAVMVSISGGTEPYLTEWSTGQFGNALQEIPAGIYQVNTTDANGCTLSMPVNITQPAPLAVSQFTIQNADCEGVANGTIATVITGGTLPYSYLWNNGQTTAAASQLTNGNYYLSVTDGRGCTFESPEYAVTAPQLLTLTMDTVQHVRCFGNNDGAFSLSVGGTIGGYTLLVNGQTSGLSRHLLTAGLYQIEVEDSRGCTINNNLYIFEPENPLVADLINTQNVTCAGEPTGGISIKTTGGTTPYQFLWSNGAITEDLEVVPTGNYSLLVTDANNCMAGITNIAIQEPNPVSVNPVITPIPCYGNPLGKIALSTYGGTPPYEYQWSNGATTQTNYDLPAGNYIVSVFDALGCLTVFDRLEIIDKSEDFRLELGDYHPVSCTANNDGRLRINVINGRPPFQYAWSAPIGLHPSSNLPFDDALHLTGGEYSVTVTDADGCFQSAGPFLVEESPVIAIQINDIQSIICKGAYTGAVDAGASGGVPPLSFLWSNGATGPVADSLPAGFYTLKVTDYRGCTAVTGLLQVIEPEQALTVSIQQIKQDICSKGLGIIDLSVTGGTPLYHYIWNTMDVSPDLDSLGAGNYTVTVTDQKGCTVSRSFELVPQPPALQLASYSVENVDCFGGHTGAIETGVSGGNLPLQYFWSNGDQTPGSHQLTAGLYAVTVIDHLGCAAIFYPPQVQQPDQPLSATFVPALLPDGYSIALICSGGTPGYTADWGNAAGNQTGLVAIGLAKGTYSVTITDANGCTLVKNISIGLIDVIDQENVDNLVVLTPNPFDWWTCLKLSIGAEMPAFLRVFASNGQLLATPVQGNCINFDGLSPGMYFVEASWTDGRRTMLKGLKL